MIKVVEIVRDLAGIASEQYQARYGGKPVQFFADRFLQIGGELSIRGKSNIGSEQKYPAILLFCDNLQERRENLKQWQVEATLHLLIVDNAAKGDNGDVQRDKVFYPILYPIYECFFDAILNHPRIFTKGDTIRYDKFDRLLLNAIIGENQPFADRLDGIELKNLRLKIVEESCFNE